MFAMLKQYKDSSESINFKTNFSYIWLRLWVIALECMDKHIGTTTNSNKLGFIDEQKIIKKLILFAFLFTVVGIYIPFVMLESVVGNAGVLKKLAKAKAGETTEGKSSQLMKRVAKSLAKVKMSMKCKESSVRPREILVSSPYSKIFVEGFEGKIAKPAKRFIWHWALSANVNSQDLTEF